MLEIRHAESDEDLAEVRSLLDEYVEFIASHWPKVDRAAFAEELRTLREMYATILLALVDGVPAGCGMLREGEGPGACEARRVYVRPAFRRRGVARELMMRLMAEARAGGCEVMQLVTVVHFTGAIPLYESLGFRAVAPYRPSSMPLDVVRFMDRPLDDAGQ